MITRRNRSAALGVALLLCLFASVSVAGTNATGDYLESTQNDDGSWGTDRSTIYFETTEALALLRLLDRTDGNPYQLGLEHIAAATIAGVEDRARRVLTLHPAARDTSLDETFLLDSRNADGGWGFDSRYDSDIYHTALALSALTEAGQIAARGSDPAVAYLQGQQFADGSFGLTVESKSVYLTALVALALHGRPGSGSTVDDALAWLLTRQNPDGGFGQPQSTVFETAMANRLLFAVDPSATASGDALDFLIAEQAADGSFDTDDYMTAAGGQGLLAALIETWLRPGLNLFGYSVDLPAGYTAFELLVDLGDETVVEAVRRHDSTTGLIETASYSGGVPTGVDFPIVPGEGYLVVMKQDRLLDQVRPVVPVTLQLQPGINPVTFSLARPSDAFAVLDEIGDSSVVAGIQRLRPRRDSFETAAHVADQPAGSNFAVASGEAYLVHMKLAREITFPIVLADYEIPRGGFVEDMRNFQGESALLDQVAFFGFTPIGVPAFVTYTTTAVQRISATDIQISFSIAVDPGAPLGIHEFQIEYLLFDAGSNPLGPLTNNVFDFSIEVTP